MLTESSSGSSDIPSSTLDQTLFERLNLILTRSSELGFLGGMPVAEQIDHALGFVSVGGDALGPSLGAILDLGSGGGIPGLVLAAAWPHVPTVLLDANKRRTDFLVSAVEEFAEFAKVEIVRGRAEELGRSSDLRQQFDLVSSRSFGPSGVTAECGAPFTRVGGVLVVSEPPEDPSVRRWSKDGLLQLGLEDRGAFRVAKRFRFRVLKKVSATPDRYPRRVGIPGKRPLF